MHKQYKEVLILSAEKDSINTLEKVRRNATLQRCLQDMNIPYKLALGKYKDSEEQSFICVVKNETEKEAILQLAFNQFDQESVLFQNIYGKVSFIYKDRVVKTGKRLKKITAMQAKNEEAYTYFNYSYWILN